MLDPQTQDNTLRGIIAAANSLLSGAQVDASKGSLSGGFVNTPIGQNFVTTPVAIPAKEYPKYVTPVADATDAVTGAKIPDEFCCTRADADHVRAVIVAANTGLSTVIGPVIGYHPAQQGINAGTLGRQPWGFKLGSNVWFDCQTYIEATMARGVGAPFTTDSQGQVHFTPAAPWDQNTPTVRN